MLDTMGAELQVCNVTSNPIKLKADDHVTITPDASKIPSAELLPINYDGLAEVFFLFENIVMIVSDRIRVDLTHILSWFSYH